MYRIRCIVNDMLQDRGYTVDEGPNRFPTVMTFEQWCVAEKVTRETLLHSYTPTESAPQSNLGKVWCIYCPSNTESQSLNVGTDGIQRILTVTKQQLRARHIVLVLEKKMTSFASNMVVEERDLLERNEPGIRIEPFLEEELQNKWYRNEMVPLHTLMSKEETDLMLKKTEIAKNQLWLIKPADPLARYIGAQEGDVVKITRFSPMGGKVHDYRLCSVVPHPAMYFDRTVFEK
jgi:DNA-directed RNA polymerase subunit H (RpoH/RPB5)